MKMIGSRMEIDPKRLIEFFKENLGSVMLYKRDDGSVYAVSNDGYILDAIERGTAEWDVPRHEEVVRILRQGGKVAVLSTRTSRYGFDHRSVRSPRRDRGFYVYVIELIERGGEPGDFRLRWDERIDWIDPSWYVRWARRVGWYTIDFELADIVSWLMDSANLPDDDAPILGARAWGIGIDHRPFGMTGGAWSEPWNGASCRYHAHAAPDVGCTCGIYAYNRLGQWVHKSRDLILGLVELSGKVVVHDGGWRAQYATVRLAIVPDDYEVPPAWRETRILTQSTARKAISAGLEARDLVI
jgi:hypothetical protein